MNKKIVLGILLVVGLVVGISLFTSYQRSIVLGADIVNTANGYPAGIAFGGPTPTTLNWAGSKILSKTNTAFWKNTTGKTQYVTYAELDTDTTGSNSLGVASSTYTLYAYATTSAPRSIYDWTAPLTNASTTVIINGAVLATSTVATSTTNYDNPITPHTVVVPANSYVDFLISPRYNTLCTPTLCETATSTNRGFNLQWRLQYHD